MMRLAVFLAFVAFAASKPAHFNPKEIMEDVEAAEKMLEKIKRTIMCGDNSVATYNETAMTCICNENPGTYSWDGWSACELTQCLGAAGNPDLYCEHADIVKNCPAECPTSDEVVAACEGDDVATYKECTKACTNEETCGTATATCELYYDSDKTAHTQCLCKAGEYFDPSAKECKESSTCTDVNTDTSGYCVQFVWKVLSSSTFLETQCDKTRNCRLYKNEVGFSVGDEEKESLDMEIAMLLSKKK